MIYNVYFSGVYAELTQVAPPVWNSRTGEVTKKGVKVNIQKELMKQLKNPKNHLLFTISKNQEKLWERWISKFNLQKYIICDGPWVANPNYPQEGPRIRAIVMKGIAE